MAVSSRPLTEDEQAFMAWMFQSYQRLMYATAARCCSNTSLCDDIVQESLLRLCKCADRLRHLTEATLAGYIQTTVRNKAADLLRQEYARQQSIIRWEEMAEVEDSAPSPEEYLERLERRARIFSIWPELTDEEQSVLVGRYISGDTDEALAARLNCKPASLRIKLTRARRRAFQLLRKN